MQTSPLLSPYHRLSTAKQKKDVVGCCASGLWRGFSLEVMLPL